ncbi:MAG TPA: hypothetical protein VKJ47_17390 [Candidatus Binatia bacterium]|nr:hypothetical protein [Candidatus Binatia bacterium]
MATASAATHTAPADDPIEQLYEQGVTDGFPAVPPTRERVERMRAGAPDRPGDELIGTIGPCYGEATVEKVAINAVMAGCKPEYFPVVLAGVEALCDERLCAHGLNVTLFSAAPWAIINGPVRLRVGLNCGHNALGHGFRANATIGRALRLVIMNVGGARPHELTKATMGQPGQYSAVVAENEEESPWEPFHVERGFGEDESTITLFAGGSPQQISDFQSRSAEQLLASIGFTMGGGLWNYKNYPLFGDTILVLSPEHAHTIAADGWSRKDVRQFLYETVKKSVDDLKPGKGGGEGFGANLLRAAEKGGFVADGCVRKFRSPDSLLLVVAGGTAGRFSVAIPGWVADDLGSTPVTKRIQASS